MKLWINQQASRIQGQEFAGDSRWYDIPVSEIPSGVRKALMPHYRYSTGMFFYEEYRFPLEVTTPVTDDKVVAALQECAMHVGEIVSAYESFSKFKRALLLCRSIICGYTDVVSTGRPTKQPVVYVDMVSNEAHCPQ